MVGALCLMKNVYLKIPALKTLKVFSEIQSFEIQHLGPFDTV